MKVPLWAPVWAWCAVIFAGSCIQGSPFPNPTWADWCLRKSAHLGEYAVLFLLARRALAGGRVPAAGGSPHPPPPVRGGGGWGGSGSFWAFLFCAAYAVSDEFHQTMVLYRDGNARDVLIDCLGAALASRLGQRA